MVYRTRLENERASRLREFESHLLRNKMKSSHLWGLFILSGVWEVDEKGGSNAESADEALSRGRKRL